MADVAKREDGLLDTISTLARNRDATADWIKTYMSTGVLDADTGEWLLGILMGTRKADDD